MQDSPFQTPALTFSTLSPTQWSYILETLGLLALLLFDTLGSNQITVSNAGCSLPGKLSRDCPSKCDKPTCKADFLISVQNSYSGHFLREFTKVSSKKKSLPLGLWLLLFGGIEINSCATEILQVPVIGFGTD